MTHPLHQRPRMDPARRRYRHRRHQPDYAPEQLGDVVFVELPEPGKMIEKGRRVLRSSSLVKAASEVYRAGLRRGDAQSTARCPT